jgi:hypothetical protein
MSSKERMWQLAAMVVMITILSASSWAGTRRPKIATTDAAAMGYADVASYGPAAAALDRPGSGFRAISVDMRGALSEGLRVAAWIDDVKVFRDGFGATAADLLGSVEDLKRLADGSGWDLGAETSLDLLRFSFSGKRLGWVSLGAYGESSVALRVARLDAARISWKGDRIDIGSDFKALKAKGWADGGVAAEYGRAITFSGGGELAVGIRHKVFHRLDIPEHDIIFHRFMRGPEDIALPDLSLSRGWGFGTDLFAAFDLRDRHVDGRIAMEARNVPATIIWTDSGVSRDMVLVGVGASLHPLKRLGVDAMKAAMDLEVFEDGNPAVHAGLSWRLGNQRFHFSPSIGGALLGRDAWGSAYHSFTIGFSAKAAVLEAAAVFEQRGDGRYDAGVRIAVGW